VYFAFLVLHLLNICIRKAIKIILLKKLKCNGHMAVTVVLNNGNTILIIYNMRKKSFMYILTTYKKLDLI
jgi:hypothetical protein